MSESVPFTTTFAIVPSSATVTVRSILPVRPSPCTVYSVPATAGSSAAGSSAAITTEFTALMMALELAVAPATMSMPSTGMVLPTNWPRKASVSHLATNASSYSESVPLTETLAIVPSSATTTATVTRPVKPSAEARYSVPVTSSAAGASTAGSSAAAGTTVFTALMIPLELTVAPATTSMPSTGMVLPTN